MNFLKILIYSIFFTTIENHSPIPKHTEAWGKRGSDFGINFASAGCGIMDVTHLASSR